jgi:hypothetical protein
MRSDSIQLIQRRASSLLGWSSLVVFLGVIVVEQVYRASGAPPPTLAFDLLGFLAAPLLGAAAALLRIVGRRSAGSVEARRDGLVIESARGTTTIGAGEMTGGFVMPDGKGARVELELRGGRTLRAAASSLDDAEALIATLGLDAARRRCRIGLGRTSHRIALGIGVAFVTSMAGLGVLLGTYLGVMRMPSPVPPTVLLPWVLVQTLVTWAAVAATRPPEVVIGADGLVIRRSWGRRRFLSFERIARVEPAQGGVTFVLEDGGEERVSAGAAGDLTHVAALVSRVREAMAARAEDPLAPQKLALLARGARSLDDWKRDLARATANAGGYRATPLSTDDLAAILERGAASRDETVGAALALRAADPAAANARIRVAADRAADDRLRVALDALAQGDADEAAIEEALASSFL